MRTLQLSLRTIVGVAALVTALAVAVVWFALDRAGSTESPLAENFVADTGEGFPDGIDLSDALNGAAEGSPQDQIFPDEEVLADEERSSAALIADALADGVVTDGEYFDAVSRVRDCMVREGFEVGELDSRADGNVMFSYIRPDAVSVSAEDSAIYQACVQAHQLPLVPLRFNG